MKDVYIVAAKRTAIGNYMGSLSSISAVELGSCVITDLLKLCPIDTDAIDEVIIGQVLTGGHGQNPARQSAIKAGLSVRTPAYTINKVCGSGLKAIGLGFKSIAIGDADLIIAGGQESMSQGIHGAYMRSGVKMGNIELKDLMQHDGLMDAFSGAPMGVTAENLAKMYNISREEQDEFALNSQRKTSHAQRAGKFVEQITPVTIKVKKDTIDFKEDESIRHDTTIESLARLRPVFQVNGTVTAGNSSGINDGAAMTLLASEEGLKKYNLTPLVRIVNYAVGGVEPNIMGIGPTVAVRKLLQKTNWNIRDIELVEANEAFAVQALAVHKELKWDTSLVNVNGGAVALGHPIGASGARVAVGLIHEMRINMVKKALACLCIGGGMGIAMSFERV